MLRLTQYILRRALPALNGALTKVVYAGTSVRIGKNFRADSVPRILIDPDATLVIADDVEFRKAVELRVHGRSTLSIGSGVRVDRDVRILAANDARIVIGDGARIGLCSVFNGGASISVGSKALISGFVYLQTSMHGHASPAAAIQDQGYSHAPVALGNDVWLGAHVVVLPGVVIGDGAIVGSNAVVTRDVGASEIVAGVPARAIGSRAPTTDAVADESVPISPAGNIADASRS